MLIRLPIFFFLFICMGVAYAKPETPNPSFQIRNNDLGKCIGNTSETSNDPMPPTYPIQHLIPCDGKDIVKWERTDTGKIYDPLQNKCLGAWNLPYYGTIFWPVIAVSCNARYTKWLFESGPHIPEREASNFKIRNAEKGTCLGVIKQDSDYPVVVLVNCEDLFFTTWSKDGRAPRFLPRFKP